MHIHLPHFKPIQRAALRSLIGALLAILLSIILIYLMAVLLVFPESAFSLNVESVPKQAKPVPKPPVQPVNRPTSDHVALQTQFAKEIKTSNLDSPGVSPMLQREPTTLSDLIPPYLRKLADNKTE